MLQYLILVYCVTWVHSACAVNEDVSVRCDYEYSEDAKGWLKLHRRVDDWYGARNKCNMEGAILASPTSQLSSSILAIMEQQTLEKIFIGINDWLKYGTLITVDGIRVTDDNIPHGWAEGEPNYGNNNENCFTLDRYGKLADHNCGNYLPFICYKKKIEGETYPCGTFSKGYTLSNSTKSCHKVHNRGLNFYNAHKWCYYEGGYLTIINSEGEANIVKRMLSKYNDVATNLPTNGLYFVGFHREYERSGDFYTVKDQLLSDVGYSKFETGEPDDITEGKHCGTIRNSSGQLNNVKCNTELGFVCEIDAITQA